MAVRRLTKGAQARLFSAYRNSSFKQLNASSDVDGYLGYRVCV
jgi:hypothetical protein